MGRVMVTPDRIHYGHGCSRGCLFAMAMYITNHNNHSALLEGVLPFQHSSPLRLSTGGIYARRIYRERKGGVPCPARLPYPHSSRKRRVVIVGFVAETRLAVNQLYSSFPVC